MLILNNVIRKKRLLEDMTCEQTLDSFQGHNSTWTSAWTSQGQETTLPSVKP